MIDVGEISKTILKRENSARHCRCFRNASTKECIKEFPSCKRIAYFAIGSRQMAQDVGIFPVLTVRKRLIRHKSIPVFSV